MFCRVKNSTSTHSTAPTIHGKKTHVTPSHLHILPSHHLTCLHCACWWVRYLFFFFIPSCSICLHVCLGGLPPPCSIICFQSFICCLLTELQLAHWQMGYCVCHPIILNTVYWALWKGGPVGHHHRSLGNAHYCVLSNRLKYETKIHT